MGYYKKLDFRVREQTLKSKDLRIVGNRHRINTLASNRLYKLWFFTDIFS